ncbi:zinc-dependent alcohol dehydrogenase family protein [Flavobacterium pectinovorum]|uniref:zinc-dependent alcohol dehydrogenase family protein n=1 Tax=Flavobacterium pectinovorum TaxID=29533 RepID=UPI001FACC548|nr:zinc-dependent alcohol dehydrogenase family protein [Flavobacterium pectinovorum]MCI9843565.1 zinc-dependent alcohol dehydrogenase family protein [Flavobacterium pectinovorum]
MSYLSKMSKTVVFHEAGKPEVLKVEQLEVPAPGPQEVRIQVKSIGINRADAMYRQGMYIENPVFPAKLGYEAAGIIEAVGTDVTNLTVGDVVNVIPGFSLHNYSSYAEYILMPSYAVHKYPTNLSYDQAASLWTSYSTMYGMIVHSGKLKSGEFVVINAASSSAGLAAIQITNYVGGISIALTTSPKKKEALLKAGASHVIVTSEEDIAAEVLKITNNIGAHLILDPVVGAKFSNLLSSVAENGRVFVYGALSHEPAVFPAFEVMLKTPTIKGYSAIEVLGNMEVLMQAIAFIDKGVAEGKLNPIIDKIFNLDEIVVAHNYLESNQQFGKIVVKI